MILLKVALWNANGLSQHKHEVQAFLIEHKIDIMLISETHFTNKSFFNIKNYLLYDTKHPDGKAHGGTAILIKSNIKHFQHPSYSSEHIQATSIVLEEWSGNCILSAIYCPPKHNIKQIQFTNFFKSLGNKFLAGGDFNAKHTYWGSRLTTTKGRELLNSMSENALNHASTGHPTYWPTDRQKLPDLIDFYITKNINNRCISVQSCFDLSSDHSPIIATLSTQAIAIAPINKITSKSTNWLIFKEKFTEYFSADLPLRNHSDIDQAVERFTQSMIQAAIFATPSQRPSKNHINLSKSIADLISKKRKLRKKYQETRSPIDKTYFNQAIKKLKESMAAERDNEMQHYLQNLTPTEATDYSLWKATRKIKKIQEAQNPIRKNNGAWARSDEEKANLFANHLAEVFTPYPQVDAPTLTNIINEQPTMGAVRFKINEVKLLIKSINSKKAPGHDQISGNMIKELPEHGVRMLTFIMNACLRLEYFPKNWKVAQMAMILKPGKKETQVTSYRPISLLSVMSKVFEKLLLRKLEPIIINQCIIPDHQFGCRKQHSTIEQVHRVVAEIQHALENKKYCSAVFLDVSQAFDKIWHEGLLYKLQKNLPLQLFNLLKSYLSERKFKVRYKTATTELFEIKSGVPQGSVLGSFLYQLYTADLPSSPSVTMATFVDDTAIMSTHLNMNTASRELQAHLNNIEKWLTNWRMKVNETKSVHITFTMKKKSCPAVSLNNIRLPQETTVKYLGMHLDRRLTWKTHVQSKRKQLKIKLSKMYWLIGRKSKLSIESKLLLYKAILKPIWTYGVQLWGSTCNSNIELLQRFQSKTLRFLLNAPWYINNAAIHRDLQIESVKEVVSKYSSNYQSRLMAHPNQLAVNLLHRPRYIRLRRFGPLDLPQRWSV